MFRYDIDETVLRQPLTSALGLLNDPDPSVRVAASGLLSGLIDKVDDKESVAGSIARLLDDASDDAQAAACINLGTCGGAASAHWGRVAAKLGSPSEKVRGYAASGLWMIGNDAAQLARDGWRFICIGEPTWILMSALRDKVAQARGAMG